MAAPTQTLSTTERLEGFLRRELPQASGLRVTGLHRSSAGFSRENWPFKVEWTEGETRVQRSLILRRDSTGGLLETERWRELAVLQAVQHASDIPSPEPYWADLTGEVLDRPFIITAFYPGENDRNILNRPALDLETRVALARRYTEVMAATHRLDWQALGLEVLGPPGSGPHAVAAREVDRWEEYLLRQAFEVDPAWAEAVAWLRAHLPRTRAVTLVHGDFRPGNSLVDNGRLSAMLDWELAHLGDPMEDLGWWCVPTGYEREHFIPGAWEHEQFLAYYEELTGAAVDRDALQFYRVLSVFKFEGILQTGIRAFCEGRADRPASGSSVMTRLLMQMIGL